MTKEEIFEIMKRGDYKEMKWRSVEIIAFIDSLPEGERERIWNDIDCLLGWRSFDEI